MGITGPATSCGRMGNLLLLLTGRTPQPATPWLIWATRGSNSCGPLALMPCNASPCTIKRSHPLISPTCHTGICAPRCAPLRTCPNGAWTTPAKRACEKDTAGIPRKHSRRYQPDDRKMPLPGGPDAHPKVHARLAVNAIAPLVPLEMLEDI